MSVTVGDQAPLFQAKATDGTDFQPFDLAEEIGDGPVVLAFFPYAFSGTCSEQLCAMRDDLSAFEAVNAKVFGVSVDSHHTLKAFHQANAFGFPLVSDFNRVAVDAYGLFYDELGGGKRPAKRAAVAVDNDGIVQYVWAGDDADELPPLDELEAVVAKLGA